MKNIDRMKQDIIAQIESMNVEKFEKFTNVLIGSEDMEAGLIDTSALFSCEKCQKIYRCSEKYENYNECSEKFKRYALSEEK
nr:MAG TPA: hypothetical protein [Caudoviricetes sp.]